MPRTKIRGGSQIKDGSLGDEKFNLTLQEEPTQPWVIFSEQIGAEKAQAFEAWLVEQGQDPMSMSWAELNNFQGQWEKLQ